MRSNLVTYWEKRKEKKRKEKKKEVEQTSFYPHALLKLSWKQCQ
jgi:hypothetical protein